MRALSIKSACREVVRYFAVVAFVVLAHAFATSSHFAPVDPGAATAWQKFKVAYNIGDFGEDGYFVRAVRNGHGLVTKTYQYAWRFTRKTANDEINACSHCHSAEDLAYAFVNSDRFDSTLGKRVSFEERIMRCYVKNLDGYVPTIYDPAVSDIRIYARAVAHYYGLVEGARREKKRQ